MSMLKVEKLCKRYERFHLKDVSFELKKGYIMGFIGANGAGKTTTMKSILNLVKKDSGKVTVMGRDFDTAEIELKQKIGFMFGGVDYYAKKQLCKITDAVSRFYTNWNNDTYKLYLKKFGLDENKKVEELSHGMKVKYALVLALSHDAKLFILDEPTSGLDPVARDGLLDIFWELIEDGERSILFSTHITSDLEKCADYITYISNGRIIENGTKDDLIASYRLIKGTKEQLHTIENLMISYKTNAFGFSGLIKTANLSKTQGLPAEQPSLEEIMIFHSKKEEKYEESAL